MKAKTKKILIIAAAVLAVAVILWLVLRGSKNTAEGIINRLDASRDIKKAIKGYLAQAASEQDVNDNAAANGINYEQALVLTAAYYLVTDGTVSDTMWQQWKAQVKAM